ncbi:MAG: T3SS effector HopA1 family protein [Janthinobacterium lividum]
MAHHPDVLAIMAPGPSCALPNGLGEPPTEMLAAVESALYRQFYIRPQPDQAGAASSQTERREFVHALSSANSGQGTWENGWQLIEECETEFVVQRGDLKFWAPRDSVRPLHRPSHAGRPCSVFVGKEMRHLVAGFYMGLGDLDSLLVADREGTKRVVRLYWHLRVEGAVPYMAAATGTLNGARVPFRTKVVGDPAAYMRADAGVLYILRDDFARAVPLLVDIYDRIERWLRPSVPMFTKRLRDGLGLAEDPEDSLSFGQSRCRLAAAALWTCHRDGIVDPLDRAETFGRLARAAGLDADMPYLEAGSQDIYAV